MKKPIIKTDEEIATLKKAGKMHREIIDHVKQAIRVGVTTWELNEIAETMCAKMHVAPAFKGYGGFPAALCTSLNDEVVHGIPAKHTILKVGDILSIDFGIIYQGLYTDAAFTVGIGDISDTAKKIIAVTKEALSRGVKVVTEGVTTGDIGAVIQGYVESEGFSVVRDCVGHGVGRKLHEPPEVPNFGNKREGAKLLENMVIAVEPIVNAGDFRVKTQKDHWTVVTDDGSLSAHFEHTVVVKRGNCEIII